MSIGAAKNKGSMAIKMIARKMVFLASNCYISNVSYMLLGASDSPLPSVCGVVPKGRRNDGSL